MADAELLDKLDALVSYVNKLMRENWEAHKYIHAKPPTVEIDITSKKWCKILERENHNDGTSRISSIYCFVCLMDGQTKALGAVRRGGIHKAASFNAPAKVERGNLFVEGWEKWLTPYGAAYLK